MSTITFSIWQLFKENSNGIRWKNPVREDFPREFDENLDSIKGINHVSIFSDDNYIFFVIESGSLEPRDEYVIDKKSKRKEKTLKKKLKLNC